MLKDVIKQIHDTNIIKRLVYSPMLHLTDNDSRLETDIIGMSRADLKILLHARTEAIKILSLILELEKN